MIPPVDLYHGSERLFDVDDVLRGRGDAYHEAWSAADFYAGLEAYRPVNSIAHKDAVFMCAWDDLDVCGGSMDVILKVMPIGPVSRHDMNWSSQISCLIGDGYAICSKEVGDAAMNYWLGRPSDDPVWEYLAAGMKVIEISENNLTDSPGF